jgi:hypothetical protein
VEELKKSWAQSRLPLGLSSDLLVLSARVARAPSDKRQLRVDSSLLASPSQHNTRFSSPVHFLPVISNPSTQLKRNENFVHQRATDRRELAMLLALGIASFVASSQSERPLTPVQILGSDLRPSW